MASLEDVVKRLEQMTLDKRESDRTVDRLRETVSRVEDRSLAFAKRMTTMEGFIEEIQEAKDMARKALDSTSEIEERMLMEFAKQGAKWAAMEKVNADQTATLSELRERFIRRDERDRIEIEKQTAAAERRAQHMKSLATWTPIITAIIGVIGVIVAAFLHR